MGLSTQVPQCFGKGHTLISPRVGRGDEHLCGLAAPLVSLVCFVDLVDLVHLVRFVQPKNQTNQINETNQRDQTTRLKVWQISQHPANCTRDVCGNRYYDFRGRI